jgi:hypothetical protein
MLSTTSIRSPSGSNSVSDMLDQLRRKKQHHRRVSERNGGLEEGNLSIRERRILMRNRQGSIRIESKNKPLASHILVLHSTQECFFTFIFINRLYSIMSN